MILEGIVTTLDPEGQVNVAPMGPRVEPDFRRFVLRPFQGSTTCRNLLGHGEGVLHVTDDVLLLARSAIGPVADVPTRPAESVRGRVLLDCCRYYEFRVTSSDLSEERARFNAETVREGRSRDFFGFNRAKHSVIEVAILATRIGFLPPEPVAREIAAHRVIVEKTGSPHERLALDLLDAHIKSVARARGFQLDRDES